MKVQSAVPEPQGEKAEQCRYHSLAVAVCSKCHISLDSALQMTLIEAYQALGAEVYV